MAQNSTSLVKVPAAAANYSNATQDQEIRSAVNALLLNEGHISTIQEHLLHTLEANEKNWPTRIQNHALNLLRSGEVTTLPNLIKRVLEDVRVDMVHAQTSKVANGAAETNGKNANGTVRDMGYLAIPQSVIDEALKKTRECLETIVELEDGSSESGT